MNSSIQPTKIETYFQASAEDLTALRAKIVNGETLPPQRWSKYLVCSGLLAGSVVSWNGEAFAPVEKLIYTDTLQTSIASITSTNSAGDTTPTTIHSLTIPGFLMGKNSKLIIKSIWGHTTETTVRHMTISVGDTPIEVVNSPWQLVIPVEDKSRVSADLINQNSFDTLYGGDINNLLAVDTTQDFVINFSAYWGQPTANDTLSIESITIELTDTGI